MYEPGFLLRINEHSFEHPPPPPLPIAIRDVSILCKRSHKRQFPTTPILKIDKEIT